MVLTLIPALVLMGAAAGNVLAVTSEADSGPDILHSMWRKTLPSTIARWPTPPARAVRWKWRSLLRYVFCQRCCAQ